MFLVFVLAFLTENDLVLKVREKINCDDCTVKILGVYPMKDISRFSSVEVIPKDTKLFGRKIFSLIFDDGKIGTLFAYVEKYVKVFVAKRDIDIGEILEENMFEEKEMERSILPPDTAFEFPYSMKSKVKIMKGEILRTSKIEKDVEVKRGDKVKLVFKDGGIYISAPALALEDGEKGKVIKVRNLTSSKIVYGVVEDKRMVIVK